MPARGTPSPLPPAQRPPRPRAGVGRRTPRGTRDAPSRPTGPRIPAPTPGSIASVTIGAVLQSQTPPPAKRFALFFRERKFFSGYSARRRNFGNLDHTVDRTQRRSGDATEARSGWSRDSHGRRPTV